jgi:ferric-dicitrate binding protein FerR (iron transport regulator)
MNNKDRIWHLISKKLANEAGTEELAELEELLRGDPEMHYALQNLSDLWNLKVRPEPEAEEALGRHLARLQAIDSDWQETATPHEVIEEDPFPSTRSPKRRYLYAASIAATLIAALFIVFYRPGKATGMRENTPALITKNEVSTKNGSRTKISLPDGSQVWLNAGSKIVYDKEFGNGRREAVLSGEAFFDVVKDTSMPFIIHTKQVDIRVVGTAFNVRSYPGEQQTETSLVRGVVEVTIHNRPTEKIILQPNEKLVVTDETKQNGDRPGTAMEDSHPYFSLGRLTYTKQDSVLVETAWVQDKLAFDNESFDKVAARMERWYNVKFEFSDSTSKQIHFTGVFQNETIQQALEALRITAGFNFRFSMEGNKVTISKK